jgi:hypothetical protein
MDWLEEELHRAFAHREAPDGFAARVIAKAGRGTAAAARRWIAAAAAALPIACAAGYAWREHQGAIARREVLLAFKITASKMNRIQAHIKGTVQ